MTHPNSIPEGFEPHYKQSPFTDPWEPLFSRILDDQVQIGVELAPAHCNSRGFAHGGFIAALADNAIGVSIGRVLINQGLEVGSLVTSNLAIDYLGVARAGQWIATDTTVHKVGRSCVASCLVSGHDNLVARVNATFQNRTNPS